MKKANVILFSLIIGYCFIMYLSEADFEKIPSKTDIAILYDDNSAYREEMISIYGLSQKLLGKKSIDQFSLYKTDYGKIVSPQKKKNISEIEEKITEVEAVFQCLEEKEIPYFYITNILPISDKADLPIGVEDFSGENAELLLSSLEGRHVPIINLRKKEAITAIDKEDRFYKTDHHWTIESCFAAYIEIIKELEMYMECSLDNNKMYMNKDNYTVETIPDSFLGSYGIKVEEYYVDKDDFTILLPKFETEFRFEAYDSEGNLVLCKTGDYKSAFLDMDILEDKKYNNKYNTFNNNCSVENRFLNNIADNDKKVLLISHSYGRPLAQYLSICFKEVRLIDPQEGRFIGDYRNYIEEYQPDIVLFFVENEGEIIGRYYVSAGEK